jgi:hypothetical protein
MVSSDYLRIGYSTASIAGAHTKGCIKGAIVGGVVGRMAGHGKLGAAVGCATAITKQISLILAMRMPRPLPRRSECRLVEAHESLGSRNYRRSVYSTRGRRKWSFRERESNRAGDRCPVGRGRRSRRVSRLGIDTGSQSRVRTGKLVGT